ncbi:DNA methylase N-4 [Acutalibacter sp. 1XD8-33]|uniref:DNA methyltransferase n=1 Tax=Acutalibacter sp. 1XD8-33 TaxID=2320081 RepID=UPI000EA03447|nr:DNA methyltransferase [Acutalibacter sp. 1XD8-33]RKJ40183.1 DNA methylase N-4 [Acutalibacter sp. 1XD8-33]
MDYLDFLRSKIDIAPETGIAIDPSEISPALLPHQRDGVAWAVRGGRRALFEAFGLGKTVQELEYCRLVLRHKGGRALIVMPLEVRAEFLHDAVELLGMEAPRYIRHMDEAGKEGIYLTNYERVRDGDIDPRGFTAASLDEASVLRSFGSKTYQTFLEKFKGVEFKLVATATPAPNKYKELIHYAGYLEVMDTGQALTRFFKRDSQKANNLTLYPGKEREFWLWVSSWALYIQKPSDLGYADDGYDLPPMRVRYHKLETSPEISTDRDGQERLYEEAAVGMVGAMKLKRDSVAQRAAYAAELVEESPQDHFILWHDLEAERREIKRLLPEAREIYGTQDPEERAAASADFAQGRCRLLATKKEISGSGCNFQRHCHRAIFVGIDFEFNDFIQAIHRIYRFLQREEVVIDIIYLDQEAEVLQALQEKWSQYNEMTQEMARIVREYGLSSHNRMDVLSRSIGVERQEVKEERFTAVHNDCVLELRGMKGNSVGLIHTSIPFSNHYEYTASYNDFGHNQNTEGFFRQMDYLSPELLRVLRPGRVMVVHVKDRVLFGSATGTGMPTMEPFHALCIEHYRKHGFQYFGMITVLTDVVRENNQTYRLGYTEQCKDGTKMGVGCPEYLLLFRKLPSDTSKAYADQPVVKSKEEYSLARWQVDAAGFWRSSGDRRPTPEELASLPIGKISRLYRESSRRRIYDYKEHIADGEALLEAGRLSKTFETIPAQSWSPWVWDDVSRMRTLNTSQSQRRQQMHVCPLQLDIVERVIERYSSPGDLVLDPFGGLMTVPEVAVKMGRIGYGIELNPDYFVDGVEYCRSAQAQKDQPTLFDLVGPSAG